MMAKNNSEKQLKVVTIRDPDCEVVIEWRTRKPGVTENDEDVKALAEASKTVRRKSH